MYTEFDIDGFRVRVVDTAWLSTSGLNCVRIGFHSLGDLLSVFELPESTEDSFLVLHRVHNEDDDIVELITITDGGRVLVCPDIDLEDTE